MSTNSGYVMVIAVLIVTLVALATWSVRDDVVIALLEDNATVMAIEQGSTSAVILIHSAQSELPLSKDVLEVVEGAIRQTFSLSSRRIVGPLSLPAGSTGETQFSSRNGGQAAESSDLQRMLFSRDGRTAAFLVGGLTLPLAGVASVASVIEDVLGPQYGVAIGGEESLQREVTRCLLEELLKLSALCVLLLGGVLFICYRSIRLVLIVSIEVALSCGLLISFMLLTGFALSLLIVLLPVIVITSGAADDIYYLDRVLYHVRGGADVETACGASATETAGPIAAAAVVSCLALVSMCFSGVPALTEFALASCLAQVLSLAFTFTLVPAIANTLRIDVAARSRPGPEGLLLLRAGTPSSRAYRAVCGIVVGSVVAFGTLAVDYIKIDDSWIENLPAGQTREVISIADAALAGGTLLQLRVHLSPVREERAQEVSSWFKLKRELVGYEGVGAVWSPVDEVQRLTNADSSVSSLSLADLPGLANGLMRYATNGNGTEETTIPVLISMKHAGVHVVGRLRREIESWATTVRVQKVEFEGGAWAQAAAIRRIAESMTWSNVVTMVVVAVSVGWVCGSWKLGALSGLCVGFAVSTIHLCLFLFGARLGLAEALFGPLVVGFAINAILRLAVEQSVRTTRPGSKDASSVVPSSLSSTVKAGAMAIVALSALLFASMAAVKDIAALLIVGIVLSIGAAQLCLAFTSPEVRR